MRYVSLFSGVEAATLAWEPLGWEAVAFCEVDEFPSAVLAERWPDVPNLGDICKVDWNDFKERYGAVDIVVGGSPCQSFSIAGGRESLQGESRLMYEYVRAVRDLQPRWLLWENVPGALSTRDDAFGCLLEALQDCGYVDLAWRVLDAQFFGVPQRRRRVFLVGRLGDGGGRSAAVLFEPESLRWDNPSSREKREELTRAVGRGTACEGGVSYKVNASEEARLCGGDGNTAGALTANSSFNRQNIIVDHAVCFAKNTRDEVRLQGGDGSMAGALGASGSAKGQGVPFVMATGQANAEVTENMTPTLNCAHEQPIVVDRAAFNQGKNAAYPPRIERSGVMSALVARGPHAVAYKPRTGSSSSGRSVHETTRE